jgi:hypothetical protein
MNADQAKKISLPDLLAQLGHEPVKVTKEGRELWYASPFRAEKEPSFHTSFLGGKWIWNDFGDIGGTVVDFAMRLQGYRSVKEALTWLDGMFHRSMFEKQTAARVGEGTQPEEPTLFSFQQQSGAAAPEISDSRQLEFIDAHPITNPAIFTYLAQERGIPKELAMQYLQEVKYRNTANGKEFFAFGMKNESDGYEVRVASSKYTFKSALKARDITVIRGTSPERRTVNVFEGMTDFLSLLVMMNFTNLAGDSLIMHSLSSFHRAVEFIRGGDYQVINTFLDNNRPGEEGTEKFKAEFGEKAASQSQMFAPYADLNDALRANKFPG